MKRPFPGRRARPSTRSSPDPLGIFAALSLVATALDREQMNPADYLIAMKYLGVLSDTGTAENGDKTVFLPYEASAALGSLGGLREMFKGAKS